MEHDRNTERRRLPPAPPDQPHARQQPAAVLVRPASRITRPAAVVALGWKNPMHLYGALHDATEEPPTAERCRAAFRREPGAAVRQAARSKKPMHLCAAPFASWSDNPMPGGTGGSASPLAGIQSAPRSKKPMLLFAGTTHSAPAATATGTPHAP